MPPASLMGAHGFSSPPEHGGATPPRADTIRRSCCRAGSLIGCCRVRSAMSLAKAPGAGTDVPVRWGPGRRWGRSGPPPCRLGLVIPLRQSGRVRTDGGRPGRLPQRKARMDGLDGGTGCRHPSPRRGLCRVGRGLAHGPPSLGRRVGPRRGRRTNRADQRQPLSADRQVGGWCLGRPFLPLAGPSWADKGQVHEACLVIPAG